jgi:16S rRNA (cytosine1402-N4)-methyltransferase
MTMVFQRYGDERHARRIAQAIAVERSRCPLETTGQLAALVARLIPRHGQRIHPATRVFQAVRMVINDEIGSLRRGLAAAWGAVKVGGRLVVLTFHSVEDRLVKDFARQRSRDYQIPGEVDIPELRRPCPPQLKWVYRKALFPSDQEQRENPRSRSAQLRVFERIHGAQS